MRRLGCIVIFKIKYLIKIGIALNAYIDKWKNMGIALNTPWITESPMGNTHSGWMGDLKKLNQYLWIIITFSYPKIL